MVVGNEVLLRGEMSSTDLIGYIRQVKAQVPMPVTYADVWEFWLRYPDVQSAVDFVTIHVLPYWEDFPIPATRAAAHVAAIRARVAAAFREKRSSSANSAGRAPAGCAESARPSPSNQARAILEAMALAKRENFRMNVIEAFDQPWKRELEGAVGGYWGIIDRATGAPKFSFSTARSRIIRTGSPRRWLRHSVDALTFGGAFFRTQKRPRHFVGRGSPRCRFSRRLVRLDDRDGPDGKFQFRGAGCARSPSPRWQPPLRSSARPPALPAVAAAFAALLGDWRTPRWHRLGARRHAVALMLVSVEAALGLVFDPRYRDIPFAPLTAAAVPFLVLLASTPRPTGSRAIAETVAAAVLALSAVYIVFNEPSPIGSRSGSVRDLIGLAYLGAARDAPSSG